MTKERMRRMAYGLVLIGLLAGAVITPAYATTRENRSAKYEYMARTQLIDVMVESQHFEEDEPVAYMNARAMVTPDDATEAKAEPVMLKEPEPQVGLPGREPTVVEQYQQYNYRGIVYTPDDVTIPSGMTLAQLKYYVARYCPSWVGLEEQILKYDSRINLVFLLSVGRWETGGGEACVGRYNSFNIRCSDGTAYVDYPSYAAGITAFVKLLTRQYLDEDGKWYEGVSVASIGEHYATERWAPIIADYGYELIDIIADADV